jgi:predicted enzyme related to lactoylglutathione lyase
MMARVLGEPGEEATGHRSLVALRVDDLDACCARITARGAALLHGPALLTDRMRVAHLKDPEGNLLELQERLLPRG